MGIMDQLKEDLKKGSEDKKPSPNMTVVQHKEEDSIPEFFIELKERIKERKYDPSFKTYIDPELNEMLGLIKFKGKVPMAGLLCYIVEQWLNEHKEEIKKLPKNRFL